MRTPTNSHRPWFRFVRPTVALTTCLLALGVFARSQTQPPPLAPRDMAMTMPGTFTLTSVGDLIIRRPASQLADAGLQAAIDLSRDADLAVGNLEGSLSNMRQFDGPMNNFMGSHEGARRVLQGRSVDA